MINCVSQNSKCLSSIWVGSPALANVGYLGFAAVISLAAFRSDAPAVEHMVQRCFRLLLSAGCEENEAAFLEHALVADRCECWLTLPLRSHPGCFWAGATVL